MTALAGCRVLRQRAGAVLKPSRSGYDDHGRSHHERGSSEMRKGNVETLHNDGRWHNVIEGTDQVSEPFADKDEAVAEGREMARDLEVEHVVKNLDGSVEDREDFIDHNDDGSEDGTD
jgi:hypothetical protein